ncbi:unnamed protein product [Caenorhabditis sp. 36 PRJEB53466]|nr:unnamed protein product [Caenorhabditis sp. 36 PRJEB53466]
MPVALTELDNQDRHNNMTVLQRLQLQYARRECEEVIGVLVSSALTSQDRLVAVRKKPEASEVDLENRFYRAQKRRFALLRVLLVFGGRRYSAHDQAGIARLLTRLYEVWDICVRETP